MSVRRTLLEPRKKIYNEKNISMMDIIEFAFRSVNPQRKKIIQKTENLLKGMIKTGGKIEIKKAAKELGYDYENAQDKHWFYVNFLFPLLNTGLLSEEYNEEIGEVVYIKFDDKFERLMKNFGDRWKHLTYKYLKEDKNDS